MALPTVLELGTLSLKTIEFIQVSPTGTVV